MQWSVSNWVSAMSHFLKRVVSGCLNLKEYAMKKLHAIVSFGVALLPVPGRTAQADLADAPLAQGS